MKKFETATELLQKVGFGGVTPENLAHVMAALDAAAADAVEEHIAKYKAKKKAKEEPAAVVE